ncbi:cellulose biosynthesis protein BcsF [Pseudomonas sp. SIMBA_077]
MTFMELVQVIGLTCGVTVLLTLFWQRIRLYLKAHVEQYLPPRYLKARGVRHRKPSSPSMRAPDETV